MAILPLWRWKWGVLLTLMPVMRTMKLSLAEELLMMEQRPMVCAGVAMHSLNYVRAFMLHLKNWPVKNGSSTSSTQNQWFFGLDEGATCLNFWCAFGESPWMAPSCIPCRWRFAWQIPGCELNVPLGPEGDMRLHSLLNVVNNHG